MNFGLFLFLLSVILLIGIPIIAVRIQDRIYWWMTEGWGMFWWFSLLVTCFIGGQVVHTEYLDSISYQEEQRLASIISIGNDKYLEGDVFLLMGQINDVDYYFFFTNRSVGYKRERLKTSQVYVVETDSKSPQVTKVMTKYKDDGFWKVFDDSDPDYYKIYVPKGTIVRDFKLR